MSLGRKCVMALIITGFLVLNAWVLISRFSAPSLHPAKKELTTDEKEKTQTLQAWDNAKVTPIASARLLDEFNTLREQRVLPSINGASLVSLGAIEQSQRDDLSTAIVGLLHVFHENSPKVMLEYANKRKMVLSPREREAALKTSQFSEGEKNRLNKMADDEFYVNYYSDIEKSHVDGVVASVSGVTVWQVSNASLAQLCAEETLTTPRRVMHVWRQINTTPSSFISRGLNTLAETSKSGQSLMLADVELVLSHDKDKFYAKTLYMVRFWYNSADKCWQPVVLVLVLSSNDIPVDIVF